MPLDSDDEGTRITLSRRAHHGFTFHGRAAVEEAVSRHTGRPWTIRQATDLAEFACHPTAILSDGAFSVFAKFSAADHGLHQFQIELAGLRLLSDRAGVLAPMPIGIVPIPGGCILILEAAQAVERAPRQWRQIGGTLARAHRVKGEQFGLETNGYFGPLPQDNRPLSTWPAFYGQRHLWPGMRLAVDSGHLPPALARRVEMVIARLPELCGPDIAPVLLHGGAQQNNFISTHRMAVVIDPAVYYGHPEMDLAYVDYFQPVPLDLFDGYQAELPIDPGFWERRDLWRIWGYLAAVTVEGTAYLPRLAAALQNYT